MKIGAAIVAVSVASVAVMIARGVGAFGTHDGSGAEGGDEEGDGPGLLEQAANVAANAVSNPTSLSAAGLDMLKRFEGFAASPYADHKGQSIGFGHLIKAGEDFLLGASITEEQASELLAGDVAWAERAVSAAVSVDLTQEQFDALVSLCFNIGETAFKRSTLVKRLNEGDYSAAADQFARWNRASGEVNAALSQRRAREETLFAAGAYYA